MGGGQKHVVELVFCKRSGVLWSLAASRNQQRAAGWATAAHAASRNQYFFFCKGFRTAQGRRYPTHGGKWALGQPPPHSTWERPGGQRSEFFLRTEWDRQCPINSRRRPSAPCFALARGVGCDPSAPDTPVMDRQPWLLAGATWLAAGWLSAALDWIWISVRLSQWAWHVWRTNTRENDLPGLGFGLGLEAAAKSLSALVAAGIFVTAGSLTVPSTPMRSSFRVLAPSSTPHHTRSRRLGDIVVFFSMWRPPETRARET